MLEVNQASKNELNSTEKLFKLTLDFKNININIDNN